MFFAAFPKEVAAGVCNIDKQIDSDYIKCLRHHCHVVPRQHDPDYKCKLFFEKVATWNDQEITEEDYWIKSK